MSRICLIPALLLVMAAGSSAIGQEDLLSELYGLGVHSYNSGDYRDAYENLSAAVEGGTKDPRAFYFRGLALTQLGRPEDARLDFAKGAQLEVAGGGDRYPIGRALERIQGTQRLTIERVRQMEKIKFQQAQLAESKRRFEDQKNIQAQEPVLTSKTPADVPPPADMIGKGVTPPAEGDPFTDDGLGTGAAEPAPVRPSVPAGEQPAGEEPAAGGDDPFGTEPAAEEPAGEEPAAGGDDPFGGEPAGEEPAAGGDDPFGGEPATEEPAAEEPAPSDDDPFGEAPAEEAPAEEAPAEEAPAAEEPAPADDDPFGEAPAAEAPAAEEPAMEEPAGEDPFGAAPAAGGAAPVAAKPAGAEGGAVRDVIRGVGAAIGGVEAGAADGRDPFDDSDEPKAPAAAGGAPAVKPAPADAGDAAEDPFGDDPAAEAAPAGDDPFAN